MRHLFMTLGALALTSNFVLAQGNIASNSASVIDCMATINNTNLRAGDVVASVTENTLNNAAQQANTAGNRAAAADQQTENCEKHTSGLRFCESTLPYKDVMLVANFGVEELDPLNTQGKGYISAIDNLGQISVFIENDGNLSAPKGMMVLEGRLFVADVNKLVVYNLRRKSDKPQIIQFPEGELFVNDIASIGNVVVVSVTNTGHIFCFNILDINNLAKVKLNLFADLPGANGIAVHGTKMYVASYNPNGQAAPENVIYVADLMAEKTEFEPLIENLTPGQYDGIAISNDGKRVYFTSWTSVDGTGAVYGYTMGDQTAQTERLSVGETLIGPADISIDKHGNLWIPDLPRSTVYKMAAPSIAPSTK